MIQSAIGVQALQNQLSRIKFFFKKLYPRIHFDVTDEEARTLRQQLTKQTEDKFNGLFS